MLVDYHLHSNYSIDGKLDISEICRKAVELGIKEIAITDHVDLDWPDPDIIFDIPDLNAYIQNINLNQNIFKESLTIKRGIEVGLQPHVLKDTENIVKSHPFDFVIASIHIIDRIDPYRGDYYEGKTKKECYEQYYNEAIKLLKSYDDFDVFGHIGYIRRYSPWPYDEKDELMCYHLVEEMLKNLIYKGKGIEVNTSGFSHISRSPMPTFEIIKRYRELGGEVITIGSDAHNLNQIGYKLSQGLSIIREAGFNYITTFEARKPIFNRI